MRRHTIAVLTCLCLSTPVPVSPAAPTRFALVELFTSEGCSSCPPADHLLAQLSADAARSVSRSPRFRFASPTGTASGDRSLPDEAFTKRQGAYARQLALSSLYTPQMVIDGEHGAVGSNEAAVKDALRAALARPRSTRLTLKARQEGDGITATCVVTSAPDSSVLWVAWADGGLIVAGQRREPGRRLRHVNVVRTLNRTPIRGAQATATVHLRRPANVAGSVVAWAQRGDVVRCSLAS
jgi:hypothetical protein